MLEITGLNVNYGGIAAVKNVSLHVNQGETVALIGANGAGKSSTLKAIIGMVKSTGSIRFQGQDLHQLEPYNMIRKGLALVPEGRGIFARLDIEENLRIGAYSLNSKLSYEQIYTLFPRLFERRKQLAGTLSGGEQQMLAIGRALMAKPKILLLDEPSMGLAPLMVEKIFEVIRQVAKEGMSVFLVEQNAKLALEVSSRGYVLESGKMILTDESTNLLTNQQVKAAYLGE